jgi:sec-independent protein translocase protein TatB
MFGIGFSELMLIGLVALIVVGPERLPKLARTAGAWLGRLNRYVSQVKSEIHRELELDELRKAQQSVKESVQKYEIMTEEAISQAGKEATEIGKTVAGVAKEAETTLAATPQAHAAHPTVSEQKTS